MNDLNRIDFAGLKKEYIEMRFNAVIGKGGCEQTYEADSLDFIREYSRQDILDSVSSSGSRFIRFVAPIALHFKDVIKRIPILGKYAVALKERYLHRGKKQKDVSGLFGLDVNNFILGAYREILERDADQGGFMSYQSLICEGLPKEGIIALLANSDEFGGRFLVKNIGEYQKKLNRFQFKNSIKKIPIIGYVINFVLLPKMLKNMQVELRIKEENRMQREASAQLRWQTILDEAYSGKMATMRLADSEKTFDKKVLTALEEFSHRADVFESMAKWSQQNLIDALDRQEKKNQQEINKIKSIAIRAVEERHNIIQELKDEIEAVRVIKERLNVTQELKEDIEVVHKEIGILIQEQNKSTILRKQMVELNGIGMLTNEICSTKLEWDTLNLCCLPSLENKLSEIIGEMPITAIGHYAAGLVEDISPDSTFFATHKFDLTCDVEIRETLLITNPVLLKETLARDKLLELYPRIKNQFIFTMPKLVTEHGITVLWGDGFSGVENEAGNYSRWFDGAHSCGMIRLYNSEAYRLKATVKFRVNALDTKAEVTIACGEVLKDGSLESGFMDFNEEIELYPGSNDILINYYGLGIQLETDIRRLKFQIRGFSITRNDISAVLTSSNVYLYDDILGYSGYIIDDIKIRALLHRCGFFEVTSFLISNGGKEAKHIETTRFAEFWTEYYTLIGAPLKNEESGVIVYVGKRKGKYYG